jgi:hypothetical protein
MKPTTPETGATESNKIAAPVVNALPTDSSSEEPRMKVFPEMQASTPVSPVPQASTAEPAEETRVKVIEKEPVPSTPKEAPEKTTVATVVPTPATPSVPANPPVQPTVPTQAPEKPLGSQASPASSAPASMAVVTPKPFFNPQLLIIAGGVLLMGALGLLVLVFRRIHKMTEPSIITRSMEHRS